MEEVAKGRGAVKQTLIRKSLQDESFRRRLLTEPKATVEQEVGQRLPAEIEIRVLEENPEVIYLVLPPSRVAGEELSEEQLDKVAGGHWLSHEQSMSEQAYSEARTRAGELHHSN